MSIVRRIQLALGALGAVLVAGTIGYFALGFSLLDALYQTVTTVTTVGFREVEPLSSTGKVFTILLILAGVGTALYTLTILLEAIIEGHLRQQLEARRMRGAIADLKGHVIICGWGRVGRSSAGYLAAAGKTIVVVDREPERLAGLPYRHVQGDVTDDAVLHEAGITRASALIAAVDTDADNVYVTLSSRALNPDLTIVARARSEESKSKLLRAGADRAVNPQLIGGRRMAAFAMQPHVAEFLDVIVHDEALDFRMEQVEIHHGSPLCDLTLGEAAIPASTGVLLLAFRGGRDERFIANPPKETVLVEGSILIAIGTPAQFQRLRGYAHSLSNGADDGSDPGGHRRALKTGTSGDGAPV